MNTGKQAWQTPFTIAIGGDTLASAGSSIIDLSKNVSGNSTIMSTFGIQAFGSNNGSSIWQHQQNGVPTLATIGAVVIIGDRPDEQGNGSSGLIALRSGDGSTLWQNTDIGAITSLVAAAP